MSKTTTVSLYSNSSVPNKGKKRNRSQLIEKCKKENDYIECTPPSDAFEEVDTDRLKEDWSTTGMDFTETGRIKYVPAADFEIDSFNPLEFPDPDTEGGLSIVVYGRRRAGKTFFTRWYWYHRRNFFDEVYVFTDTKGMNFYDSVIPSVYVCDGWNPERLELILKRARKLWEKKQKTQKKGKPRILLWLEDLAGSEQVRYSDLLKGMYVKGRHYGITIGFNVQKTTAVLPIVRINTDIAVVFVQQSQSEVEVIYDSYLSTTMNKRTATELINMYSQRDHALVIEMWRKIVHPIEAYIKTVHAAEPPGYKMKCTQAYMNCGKRLTAFKKSEKLKQGMAEEGKDTDSNKLEELVQKGVEAEVNPFTGKSTNDTNNITEMGASMFKDIDSIINRAF
jgi:hypothetical protein